MTSPPALRTTLLLWFVSRTKSLVRFFSSRVVGILDQIQKECGETYQTLRKYVRWNFYKFDRQKAEWDYDKLSVQTWAQNEGSSRFSRVVRQKHSKTLKRHYLLVEESNRRQQKDLFCLLILLSTAPRKCLVKENLVDTKTSGSRGLMAYTNNFKCRTLDFLKNSEQKTCGEGNKRSIKRQWDKLVWSDWLDVD